MTGEFVDPFSKEKNACTRSKFEIHFFTSKQIVYLLAIWRDIGEREVMECTHGQGVAINVPALGDI